MGYAQGIFNLYNQLAEAGHLKPGARLLDFGSENLHGVIDIGVLRRFMGHFSPGSSPSDSFLETLVRDHGKVADLFGPDGYLALDMYDDPRAKVRKFDLNFDSLPAADRGAFDLVGNLGTTEHVANQFNCFKVIHEAVKVGGLMVHYVPFWGGINHGLVKYEPRFFTTLIANNGYEALDWYFNAKYFDEDNGDRDTFQAIDQAHGGAAWQGQHFGFSEMVIICRKLVDAPFAPPTDFVDYGDAPMGFPSVNEVLATGPTRSAARVHAFVEDCRSRSARVVLYGIGLMARQLARSTRLLEAGIVGVVDSSPKVQGTRLADFPITGPETLAELRPDVVLITSLHCADEIARDLGTFLGPDVEIARLF